MLALQAGEAGGRLHPEGRLPPFLVRRQQQVVDHVRRQPGAGVVQLPAAVLLEADEAGAEAARPDDRPPCRRTARRQLDHRAGGEARPRVVAGPGPPAQTGHAAFGGHPERPLPLRRDGLHQRADREVGQHGRVREAGGERGRGSVDAVEAQEPATGADPERRPAGLRARRGEAAHVGPPQPPLLFAAALPAAREAAGSPHPYRPRAPFHQRAHPPGRQAGARRDAGPDAVPEPQEAALQTAEPETAVARREHRPALHRPGLPGDLHLLPRPAVVAHRSVRPDVPLGVLGEGRIGRPDAVAPGEQAPREPAVGIGGNLRRPGLDDRRHGAERRRSGPSLHGNQGGGEGQQERQSPGLHRRINRLL